MIPLTYNELLGVFETMATNHFQIKRFGSGVLEDINTFGPTSGEFPILWVVPQDVELGENSMIYRMRVLVFDIDDENDSHRTEILSDTLQILNDIVQEVKNDDERYSVIGAPSAIPFNQRFVDYCTGWFADVRIETAIMNSRCSVPSN